jgi:hypothetical protein
MILGVLRYPPISGNLQMDVSVIHLSTRGNRTSCEPAKLRELLVL